LPRRISSFELAYRMQLAAPRRSTVAQETLFTQQLYGLDRPECAPSPGNA